MGPAQEGEQGPSGPHGGRGQPFSPMARGLLSLRVRVRQLGRVGGAAGPTGSSAWNVLSPEQRPASSPAEAVAEAPGQPCRWFGGLYPPSPSSAQPPQASPPGRGPTGGRDRRRLTRPTLSALLSSSGMGTYTARATQLAKMVSRMMVSKGLRPALRSEAWGWQSAGERLLGVSVPRLPRPADGRPPAGCTGPLGRGEQPPCDALRPRSSGSRLRFPL